MSTPWPSKTHAEADTLTYIKILNDVERFGVTLVRPAVDPLRHVVGYVFDSGPFVGRLEGTGSPQDLPRPPTVMQNDPKMNPPGCQNDVPNVRKLNHLLEE